MWHSCSGSCVLVKEEQEPISASETNETFMKWAEDLSSGDPTMSSARLRHGENWVSSPMGRPPHPPTQRCGRSKTFLLFAVRADIGHANRNLARGDILVLFVNDIRKHHPRATPISRGICGVPRGAAR